MNDVPPFLALMNALSAVIARSFPAHRDIRLSPKMGGGNATKQSARGTRVAVQIASSVAAWSFIYYGPSPALLPRNDVGIRCWY